MFRRLNTTTTPRSHLIAATCAEAHRLRRSGQYEDAVNVLFELWPDFASKPLLDGLPERDAAEVLLVAGLLTSQLGPARKLADAQERAKDLLTESQHLFERAGDQNGAAEALSAQGYCCTRAGAFDDARIFLEQALSKLSPLNRTARAEAVMRLAAVAERQHEPRRALKLLKDNYSLFNHPTDADLRRLFYCCYSGSLTWLLRQTEASEDAAGVLSELLLAKALCLEARHNHFLMMVENNTAIALMYLRDFPSAHLCLDRADALAVSESRPEWAYSLQETRTLVLMAEGRLNEAERLIAANVAALEGYERKGLLCESLTTQGEVFARCLRFEQARTSFLRAVEIAEFTGDLTAAERAGEQLQRIAKLASVADARARTFVWQMGNDSMIEAGLRPGGFYRFRQSAKWRDGDIVAVVTPEGQLYIAYIHDAPPVCVKLTFGNQEYKTKYYYRDALAVHGVLDVLTRGDLIF